MNARRVSWCLGVVTLLLGSTVPADDGVTFRYKMAKGDKRFSHSKLETKVSQTIMGMPFETLFEVESAASRVIDDVDGKGYYHFSEKTEWVKAKGDLGPGGGAFIFDSKSNERDTATQAGAALTPVFERMTGAVIQVVMTPEGEVKEVKGFTELFRDLIESNPLAAQFTGGGTDAAAKQSMQDQLPQFGTKPLKPGDTWEVPSELELPKIGKVKGKRIYRYVGPDKVGDRATAKLDVTGEVVVEINTEMNGAVITGSLKTTASSGTIQFDPERARVILHESSQTMSGDLNVSVNGMNIPIHQEQTVKHVGRELDKLPE